MAYFEGNALYIKGAQRTNILANWISKLGYINMGMDGCTFQFNYGLNVGLGAAISINGMQDKLYQDNLKLKAAALDPIRSKSLNRDDYTWMPY